jgi:hypothetical protein
MTKKECIQILAIVSTAYPNTKVKDADAMVSAWEMCLGDFSAESVYKAARLHMNTNRFFPTPADIRSNIVRAEMVYRDSEIDQKRLEAKPEPSTAIAVRQEEWTDEKLDDLCRFVGLGYPNEIED